MRLKEAFITKTSFDELIEEGGKHPLAVERLKKIKDQGLDYSFEAFVKEMYPNGIYLGSLWKLLEDDFDLVEDELGLETITESIPKEPIVTEDTVKLTTNNGWNIVYDGYGFGFTDGYTVDRITVYDDGKWASDSPERLPAYIKREMNKLIDKYGVEFFDRRNTPLNKKLGFEESLAESQLKETAYGKDELWDQINNSEYAYNALSRKVKECVEKGLPKDYIVTAVRKVIYGMKDDFGRLPTTQAERQELAQDFVEDELQGYSFEADPNVPSYRARGKWVKKSLTEANVSDVERQLERAKSAGDDTQAWDLALCIENDEDIYNRFITPAINNLKRKAKRGIYDRTLAVQLFYYVVENSLKYGPRWFPYKLKDVTVPTRYLAADELVDFYQEEFETEN